MGTLYIVATPIGNLEDITLRALNILKNSAYIACEDTRHTLKLLNRYEIKKPLISYYSQKKISGLEKILKLLEENNDIAYVSDAGTPGISDPGSLLVREARNRGIKVLPVPGPSAFTALLSAAGIFDKAVLFEGFLSPKAGKRKSRLKELLAREEAFVLYESPNRMEKLLTELKELQEDAFVVAGRELTKIYEEFLEGTPEEVLQNLVSYSKLKGEFAVLVSGKKKAKYMDRSGR
jgi:16S rRNA (cytidine1402-2'-O)-methyltransferase